MYKKLTTAFLFSSVWFVPLQVIHAQLSDTAAWAATVQNEFTVTSNVTYLKANNMELRVDVYRPRNAEGPVPTFIYYHGGG